MLDWRFKTSVGKGGGGWGVLPQKILKTKKAEASSAHFAGAILP